MNFRLTAFGAAVLAALCSPVGGATARQAADDTIAARVNGKPVYFSQIRGSVDSVVAKYRRFGGTMAPESLKRVQREELEHQVRQELLVQAGEKECLPADIDRIVDERMNAVSSAASQGNGGKSVVPQNRQALRRLVLIDEYLARRGLRSVQVPDQELMDYYRQNREQFRESESVKVSHILITLPKNAKAGDVVKAKTKIDDLREDLRKGKDFEELAKAYSNCSSAKDGGSLGFIRRSFMPREFEDVAFRLKVGELSEVVKTRHGFHLIKIQERKESRIPEFSEVKAQIEKLLLKKAQVKRVEEVAGELRKEAKVELYLD